MSGIMYILSLIIGLQSGTIEVPEKPVYSIQETAEMGETITIRFGTVYELQADETNQRMIVYVEDTDYYLERRREDVEKYDRIKDAMEERLLSITSTLGPFSTGKDKATKRHLFYRTEEYKAYKTEYLIPIYVPYKTTMLGEMERVSRSTLIYITLTATYVGKTVDYQLTKDNVIINTTDFMPKYELN